MHSWPPVRPASEVSNRLHSILSVLILRSFAIVQIHHSDLVHSTACQIQPPIGSCHHIADHAAPDGIGFVLKLSDLGSNLTRVLGFTPDSLYQTSPSFVIAIPYGS